MLGRQSEPFDLQFHDADGEDVDGAIVVMVSNNPYVMGTSPDNAQRRRLDRGELGVFAVTTSTGSRRTTLHGDGARPAHAQPLLEGVHHRPLRAPVAVGSRLRRHRR
jgi:hypothetical protein